MLTINFFVGIEERTWGSLCSVQLIHETQPAAARMAAITSVGQTPEMSFKSVRGPHNPIRTTMPLAAYRVMGFGTVPVDEKHWQPRIDAVRIVSDALSSRQMPSSSEELLAAFSVVKGLFSRIALGDTGDWYTISRLLGYPSARLSLATSWRMAWARAAIRAQDADVFRIVSSRIYDDHCLEMLNNYLDMAIDATHPLVEHGWAYILWSSTERDAMHVGAASGSVEDVVKRLSREHPKHAAFGILSAWLIHDPLIAYARIQEKLSPYALGDGFFRLDLGTAKTAVETLLCDTDNISHSPWHGDQALSEPIWHTTASGEQIHIR